MNCVLFHVDTGVEGSGDDGTNGGSQVVSLDVFRECSDRVMMPCDFEEFITASIHSEYSISSVVCTLMLFTVATDSIEILTVFIIFKIKRKF